MQTELMWCNGECSRERQHKTAHTVRENRSEIVYRCQRCGAEQHYSKPAEE